MKPSKAPPLITLTTDFGIEDHYVGTMKGVIASICTDAHVIDITHGVPPYSTLAGAYAVSQASSYFPERTIHVAVVDPGVGSARRAIAVKAEEQYFIAPDNGLLSIILHRDPEAVIRSIENETVFLEAPSATFHGRDIFAPAAAHLASRQVKFVELGPEIDDAVVLHEVQPEQTNPNEWRGTVLSIDRFGNVISNLPAIASEAEPFRVSIGSTKVTRLSRTFSDNKPGELFVYQGSSGYLEIGLLQQSAAEKLGVKVGDSVALVLGASRQAHA